MKLKTIIYSLSLTTLILACDNESLQMDSNEALLETNLKGIANAPEESGMYLIRGEQSIAGWTFADTKTGLTMVIGLNVSELCVGGSPIFDYVASQEVDNPNDMVVNLMQGEIYIEVFEGYGLPPSCDFINSSTLLAEGTANLIYTDNDLFAYDNPGPNYNAFSLMVTGQLEGSDGSMKNLEGGFHARWNPNNPDSYTESAFVRLR